MVAGYDKRIRFSKTHPFKVFPLATGVTGHQGVSSFTQESVISFRDDVDERYRLDPADVDPYNGFYQGGSPFAEYLNPGPHLLAQLEASGLAEPSDYKTSRALVADNGHPFQHHKTTVRTSLPYGAYYWPDGTSNKTQSTLFFGKPVGVYQMTLADAARARAPFAFKVNTTTGHYSYRFRADSELLPELPVDDDLPELGTQAIALCAPAVPEIQISAVVGELFAGLPQLPGNTLLKSLRAGSLGGEYLNVVFGILPTLGDAKNLAKVLRTYSMKLHQLRRDEGRAVRRKFGFPTQRRVEAFTGADLMSTGTYVTAGGGYLGFQQRNFGGWQTSTNQQLDRPYTAQSLLMEERKETWFKGSFTYVIPEIPGFSGRLEKYLAETDKLLGISLDSSAAWQLSPWSWLIDWFIDVGDQLDAIKVSHDDNLVLNYGYAMQTTTRVATASVKYPAPPLLGASPEIDQVNTTVETVSKRRIRANPYGFVLDTDGAFWNEYRLAVLGALGLSRR